MDRPSLGRQLPGKSVTRRQVLQTTIGQTVGISILPGLFELPLAAQEAKWLNRFPRMVQNFMVSQVRQAEQKKLQTLQGLKTRADAEAYVKSVREKIQLCFGPEPERTDLNPRVTGIVEREDYQIENIIFIF